MTILYLLVSGWVLLSLTFILSLCMAASRPVTFPGSSLQESNGSSRCDADLDDAEDPALIVPEMTGQRAALLPRS